MFTGIIERTGQILDLYQAASGITEVLIDAGKDYATKLGDSIAVNGACLTVVDLSGGLKFQVSSETLAKTAFDKLGKGSIVNLERAMKLGDRLDGHIVAGHVDGVGVISRVESKSDGWDIGVEIPAALGKYIIPKGSITVEGVSLTVNTLSDTARSTHIGLMLIPLTLTLTNLGLLKVGQKVNIEVDMLGKYVERLTAHREGR